MMDTPDLIEKLAANVLPVRRLRPPMTRACAWLLLGAAVLALVAVEHGLRLDIAERLRQPAFVFGLLASAATGILAAMGCFLASLPDRSRLWLLLPAPALAVWLSTIGYGCLTDWLDVGPDGVYLGETAQCFATLLLVSVPLSVTIFVMVRHVARLRPTAVALTAGLAVAGMVSTALSLFHQLDASIMILAWNLGGAAMLVAVEAMLGRRFLQLAAAAEFVGQTVRTGSRPISP